MLPSDLVLFSRLSVARSSVDRRPCAAAPVGEVGSVAAAVNADAAATAVTALAAGSRDEVRSLEVMPTNDARRLVRDEIPPAVISFTRTLSFTSF